MSDADALDPRALTFSQAQGYEDLPQALRLEEVSSSARRHIWNLLYVCVKREDNHVKISGTAVYEPKNQWTDIFYFLHTRFLNRFADDFHSGNSSQLRNAMEYKGVILGAKFNRVFDLLQSIMRQPSCPADFIEDAADIFRREGLAYVIDAEDPPTIFPAVTEVEAEAISGALRELQAASLEGAVEHLRQAAECFNQADWSGAIRESIHSVESIARLLDPGAAKTLGPALESLEQQGRLHPALKQGFSNLYGYTSDEQGIRHALIDEPESPAGRDEALFMLGACASFASYLWRRHQAEPK